MKNRKINLSPSQLLILIFFLSIFIGALLLKLPLAATKPMSLINALFTATSAMTVTGLAVVDTGTNFYAIRTACDCFINSIGRIRDYVFCCSGIYRVR
jgi:Trk-type K+ transport system membrane component